MTISRTSAAERLIGRNRATRGAFVVVAYPIARLVDRLTGHPDRVSLRRGLRWAWTGRDEHIPAIRTAEQPATIRRRSPGMPR